MEYFKFKNQWDWDDGLVRRDGKEGGVKMMPRCSDFVYRGVGSDGDISLRDDHISLGFMMVNIYIEFMCHVYVFFDKNAYFYL